MKRIIFISIIFLALINNSSVRDTTVVTVPITYDSVNDIYFRDLTLIAQVGNISSSSVFVEGSMIESTYNPSTGQLAFTTSATQVRIYVRGVSDPSSITITKAPLKYNKKWAWSHSFDDN